MLINDIAPNFKAMTTHGKIDFHEWLHNDWCVFVSHPKDFTPICTTEIGLMAKIQQEFRKRDVKFIAHSADKIEDHRIWIKDVMATQGVEPSFPIIADYNLNVSKLYGMLPSDALPENRSAAQNAMVRAVYVIDPNKKIRAMTFYPMSAGRNFEEILRLVDSLQLTDEIKVATPVNWKSGDPVLIPPAISDEQANVLFPQGWTTKNPTGCESRPYLRYVNTY